FIQAFAYVKKAGALANYESGALSKQITDAVCQACDKLINGEYIDQFVTDMIQGGAGTSGNMNVNEVIANVALEILGRQEVDYAYIHPNYHVHFSQSTNDACPTAFRLALYVKVGHFIETLNQLLEPFAAHSVEYKQG